jgi:chromosome partitioning protein
MRKGLQIATERLTIMIKIAFFNNKGGVGKSTSTINAAHAMARLEKRVLAVDCDNQMNTFCFFADTADESYYGATRYENIRISYNKEIVGDFDYIIFDLPPALDERTKHIITGCDYVFVPFELGTFAIQGIANVTEVIASTDAKFGGCFVNKFDRENPADHKLNEMFHKELAGKAMKARIPYSRVIKNSISYRMTAFEYMEWTSPAEAYMALTEEIMAICAGGENNA